MFMRLLKTTKVNLFIFHRKIMYNKKICDINICSQTQSHGHNMGSDVKSCLSNCSEKYESRKIMLNEKVCLLHPSSRSYMEVEDQVVSHQLLENSIIKLDKTF